MKAIITAKVFFCVFVLAGCAANVVQPTATPVPTSTFTALPTWTATATPAPTGTPPPATGETKNKIAGLIPQGEPAHEWNGIPIMPDAIAGEGDAQGYRFTTESSREEIQNFYERELAASGWELLGVGEGEAGAAILFFTGGQETVSISIFPNGETLIVMIIK